MHVIRWPLVLAALVWILMWLAGAALSAETCRADSGSGVTIRATVVPGAVAEVEFNNTSLDGLNVDLACVISLDDLDVAADLTLGRGGNPDTAALYPPEGFISVPPDLTIDDASSDVMLIFPKDRMLGF